MTDRSIIQEVIIIKTSQNNERKKEFLEKCFDVCCRNGLENTTLLMLSQACGVTNATLLYYFETKDNIIIEATAYCMAKVEDEFMERAPEDYGDIERFLDEMPYITANLHGEKYRFMYQVYASPKFREHGIESGCFSRGTVRLYDCCQQFLDKCSG